MTDKQKLILENFKKLEMMEREIFKNRMQVIMCSGNSNDNNFDLRSMNINLRYKI